MAAETKQAVVAEAEVKRFIVDCMTKVGTPPAHTELTAEVLLAADRRGHYSHGLNRLEMYMKEIEAKICDAHVKPVVLKETAATAWVDGRNGLGFVVGDFCMKLAIRKAKECGVGWVAAKGSNHFGIAGWYSMMAADAGLVGISLTNTSPFMVPTRAKKPFLGTNPLSVAAPGERKDDLVVDMATTAVALGKLELKRRAGAPLPPGWAVDDQGRETSDAALAITKGALMPLGGGESSSGFKGYGMALIVELFTGIMGGASFGPHIRKWGLTADVANLGQGFVAIDPNCFAPGLEGHLSELMNTLRNADPVEKDRPVLVPGDPEKAHEKEIQALGGIPYHSSLITGMKELAERWNVRPLQPNK